MLAIIVSVDLASLKLTPYGLFEERLRRRLHRFANLKILQALPGVEQFCYPMRPCASSVSYLMEIVRGSTLGLGRCFGAMVHKRKIVVYIATSADGFIARSDGSTV
jgi:hypothetical protein